MSKKNINNLIDKQYREIEKLKGESKSSVSRKLNREEEQDE